ncbi:hypothetical protein P872_15895 [Rhodonellum psychrophilum GCM71 = DSM 17998]|uniref:Uncharacterized protein n=2 Tax=Rhodonellum TaxID=336827 RepID=U5C367_9BACT|nr:hypothetical protein P872_15895 [Rhodonellum psychrophilum GCM71 = DSM 17998]
MANQDLNGIWISTDDLKWIWEFKNDDKIYSFYNGKLINTYSFSFEKTSPQCGQIVDEGPLFEYLKIININDSQDIQCYEILSKDEDILQIRPFGRGGSITFKKSNSALDDPDDDFDYGDGDQQFLP